MHSRPLAPEVWGLFRIAVQALSHVMVSGVSSRFALCFSAPHWCVSIERSLDRIATRCSVLYYIALQLVDLLRICIEYIDAFSIALRCLICLAFRFALPGFVLPYITPFYFAQAFCNTYRTLSRDWFKNQSWDLRFPFANSPQESYSMFRICWLFKR